MSMTVKVASPNASTIRSAITGPIPLTSPLPRYFFIPCSVAGRVVRNRTVCAPSRRLTAAGKLALPQAVWPTLAARVAAGESLRALGREYGVSRECIRRIATAAQCTTMG